MNKEKLVIDDSKELITKYKNTKGSIWLDTSDDNIKTVVFWKEKSTILVVVNSDNINDIDYKKYVLKDLLDNELNYEWKKYYPIWILSNEDFVDWNYKTSEHLAMEIIDEFKWRWIWNEIFRVKNSVDDILSKSSEKIVSNIYMLLKNWYKVVWKINKDTGIEELFSWQKFIEKIIEIKRKKWEFDSRLDSTYVFVKE